MVIVFFFPLKTCMRAFQLPISLVLCVYDKFLYSLVTLEREERPVEAVVK